MNRDILTACELRIAGHVQPTAIAPQKGDVWRAKDGRLIVVIRVSGGTYNPIDLGLYINGVGQTVNAESFPFFMLSLEAQPVDRVERGKM